MTRYVVTYDIADPKRLYRVFRTIRRYGDHLQLSVFECRLDDRELLRLQDRLRKIISPGDDQILFIRLGPAGRSASEDATITALGLPYHARDLSVTVY